MLPSKLAVSGGIVYWMDPDHGQISRADATTGALLPPLTVGPAPAQTTGGQPGTIDAPVLDASIAIYEAGASSQILFERRGWSGNTFRKCNLDGSNIQSISFPTGSGFLSGFASAITCDSVNGKFYWTRPNNDQTAIFRSDLDGNNPERAVAPVDSCDCDIYTITAMAIDSFGTGRLYWYESLSNRIVYENLTDLPDLSAAHLHQVITNAKCNLDGRSTPPGASCTTRPAAGNKVGRD